MIERFEHEGVEALRVGRFGAQINTTCIVYRLGDTVVDSGPSNQWRKVRRFLEERRVRQVVVTHHHEDHSGNLAALHTTTGARALAPAGSLDPLERGFPLRAYQKIFWGRAGRLRPELLPETIEIGSGRVLEPIAAPGHSADMTCFLEPQRGWLFSGDLYIAAKTKYLRRDEDVGDQIASLRRLLALDFGTLFCAHRGVIREGREALAKKLAFLEELSARVAGLHGQGLDVAAITRRLLGREDLMHWITAFHFSKRQLVASCLEAARRSPEEVP